MSLAKWERASNYIGEDFSEYFVGPSRSRDSDLVTQSNFDAALRDLGGESETVIVSRSSHWACGWVEQILVHKTDFKALNELKSIKKAIEEDCVLDSSDLSEREHDEQNRQYEEFGEDAIEKALEQVFTERYFEVLKKSIGFVDFKREVWDQACQWYGVEDAYVGEDNIIKMIESMWVSKKSPMFNIKKRLVNLHNKMRA